MTETLSPADVAAVTRGNYGYGDSCGFGGNSAWVLIILFALIFGWGGNGFGNRGGAEPVTEAGLCNSMNFNNLENAVGRLNDSQQAGFTGIARDMCTSTSAINAAINQSRFENQACCCETQREIANTNFNISQSAAAINANTTAQTQKILDALCSNRMADMQNQINHLQLQSALCGVVRYPTMTTFATNCNPFGGYNSCSCGNI